MGGGIVGGVVLDLIAFLVARYGPAGDGWSLRGNGALVVPFGLGPAVLAAGWAWIVAHARGARNWWQYGIVGGVVGVALVVASIVALTLGRSAGLAASGVISLAVFIWMAVAPLLAALLGRDRGENRPAPLPHVAAAAALLLALVAGYAIGTAVLPAGS